MSCQLCYEVVTLCCCRDPPTRRQVLGRGHLQRDQGGRQVAAAHYHPLHTVHHHPCYHITSPCRCAECVAIGECGLDFNRNFSPPETQVEVFEKQVVQYNTLQYNTVQCSTAQNSTVQCSTAQYSSVQHSTAQYSTVQCVYRWCWPASSASRCSCTRGTRTSRWSTSWRGSRRGETPHTE